MGKQHDTIPNEPQEAPLTPGNPEVLEPQDPGTPTMPEEAPDSQPQELPDNDLLPKEQLHETAEDDHDIDLDNNDSKELPGEEDIDLDRAE